MEVLSLWHGRIAKAPPTLGADTIRAACEEFGIPRQMMLARAHHGGRGGVNPHRDARDATMYRLRQRGLTYTRIAQMMGLDDHTSARTAVRRHAKRLAEAQSR